MQLPQTPQAAQVAVTIQHEHYLTSSHEKRQALERVRDISLVDTESVQPQNWLPAMRFLEFRANMLQKTKFGLWRVAPAMRDEEINIIDQAAACGASLALACRRMGEDKIFDSSR